MLFPEEDAALLKTWIVKRLENTSDADADVLADYVLALLRHDGAIEDIRKLCEEEIPDFLKEDSSVFLDDVFAAIEYKSYLPGARPAPKVKSQSHAVPSPATAASAPRQLAASSPSFTAAQSQNGSRKRSYHEPVDTDVRGSYDRSSGGRPPKQPRRHGLQGQQNTERQRGSSPTGFVSSGPTARTNRPPTDPMRPMEIDPASFSAAMLGYQPPSFSAPPHFPAAGRGQPPKRRRRCREYDTQGYCTRGINCMFEHGPASAYVPPPPPQAAGIGAGTGTGARALAVGGSQFDGYDPTNAALFLPTLLSATNGQMPLAPLPPTFPTDGRAQIEANDGRQGRVPKSRRGARSQLSAEGAVYDKSKSTVVVENIPEESFTENAVRGFFSQFGKIVQISMQPYKRLALVKYDKWHSANSAYKSPKVIFDNRFVRVYWYREDDKELPASTPLNGHAAVPTTTVDGGDGDGEGEGGKKKETNGQGSTAGEPDFDLEEFRRKQEDAQAAYEEKKRLKEEVERQRQELEQRQKELLARQQAEKQKLYAKIAAASHGKTPAESVVPKATTGDKSSPPTSKTGSAHTEALRAQLAALEEEAKSMGLNPHDLEDPEQTQWDVPPHRGGWRGRGRGGYYRPSGYPPRGFRGGFRGRGGGGAAAYAAYSIDNRPKKVAVAGVDFTEAEKDEKLRHYLLGIGEFTDIKTTPAVTHITFKDRRTAETFYYGASGTGKGIPGIEGQIELSWVSPVSDPATSSGSASVSAGGGGVTSALNSGGKGNDDDTMDNELPSPSDLHDDQEQVNMDYDLAEDQDWDVA